MTLHDAASSFRHPPSVWENLKDFEDKIEQFRNGLLSKEELKSVRVLFGIYEEKIDGSYLIRIRLPGGILLSQWMRTMSETAKKFGGSRLHLTTRQDVQIRNVSTENLIPALKVLMNSGCVTRGSCGNTVRNITVSASDCCSYEQTEMIIDHAVRLNNWILSLPSSYELPRKFKISISCCEKDTAGAMISDLGFILKKNNGKFGFTVYVGGGLGAHSRIADKLMDFAAVSELPIITETVKRVFHKHGDRSNRQKARVRHLIERIGFPEFNQLFMKDLSEVRHEFSGQVHQQISEADYEKDDLKRLEIPCLLGDIDADVLNKLAELSEQENYSVQVISNQNFVVHYHADTSEHDVIQKLNSIGLSRYDHPLRQKMVVCAGAETCRLGLCDSRKLAASLVEAITEKGLQEIAPAIHISGCPNSCARHRIAPIGLHGVMRMKDGIKTPHYALLLGGRLGEKTIQFGRQTEIVPEADVPSTVVNLLTSFKNSSEYPDFYSFLSKTEQI